MQPTQRVFCIMEPLDQTHLSSENKTDGSIKILLYNHIFCYQFSQHKYLHILLSREYNYGLNWCLGCRKFIYKFDVLPLPIPIRATGQPRDFLRKAEVYDESKPSSSMDSNWGPLDAVFPQKECEQQRQSQTPREDGICQRATHKRVLCHVP